MSLTIRELGIEDAPALLALYVAAAGSGTLGRDPDEYDEAGVRATIEHASGSGFCLGAFDDGRLRGEIHASRLQARRFRHVFSGLSAAVHPDEQGRGLGRRLFEALLARIDALEPPVDRVELMLQAGNPAALHLYASLGFREEGRLVGRVRAADGALLDDIQMARLRPVT